MDTNYIKAHKGNSLPIYRGKDYTGEKFGSWTILGEIKSVRSLTSNPKKKYKHRTTWLCKCDCGSDPKWVPKDRLFRENSQGCYDCRGKRTSGKNNVNWSGYESISGTMFNHIKQSAKARDIDFKIDIKYLDELWIKSVGKCALSSMDITLKNSLSGTASLDRIDSSKGYVKGNVQWVHKNVNIMKRALSQDEFINICRLVADNWSA